MDISKWKSVAIAANDYKILKSLCKSKFRAPGAMISKLLNDYVEHQAKKNKTTVENFKKKLLNGDSNDDRERSKKS
tara:strand:+ start:500 stop:727 length:228 start_codon:yes stop_codon:yes gene_type:complete